MTSSNGPAGTERLRFKDRWKPDPIARTATNRAALSRPLGENATTRGSSARFGFFHAGKRMEREYTIGKRGRGLFLFLPTTLLRCKTFIALRAALGRPERIGYLLVPNPNLRCSSTNLSQAAALHSQCLPKPVKVRGADAAVDLEEAERTPIRNRSWLTLGKRRPPYLSTRPPASNRACRVARRMHGVLCGIATSGSFSAGRASR